MANHPNRSREAIAARIQRETGIHVEALPANAGGGYAVNTIACATAADARRMARQIVADDERVARDAD